MSQTIKQRISVLTIFLLIVTLIPIQYFVTPAYAADAAQPIVITSPMGTKDAPTQVTNTKIDISGSLYGVSNLKYELIQYRRIAGSNQLEKVTSRVGDERAQMIDSTFTFRDIALFEGINEIYVSGTFNGQTVGDRKFVEVTQLPVITSIFYNTQDLRANNRITTTLMNDELHIRGTIYNADTISAKVNGSTEYPGSVVQSTNTYVIAKLPIQRGKNTIELIARNITKTYPLVFEVYYDDKQPFVSGQLDNGGTDKRELKNPMTFSTEGITIQGQIHNFQSNPDDIFEITFNGTANKFSLTRTQFDELLATTTKEAQGAFSSGVNYTFTAVDSTGKFSLVIDKAKQNAQNYLTFSINRGPSKYQQAYTLEQLDEAANFVVNVSGINDTVTSKKLHFFVTTKLPVALTSDWVVHQYLDGTGVRKDGNKVTAVTGSVAPTYQFEVDLMPGINIITVRPNANTANPTNALNAREYQVMYVNSPDVKVLNLVNGDRIGGDSQLLPELYAELINITNTNIHDKVKITIENGAGKNTYPVAAADFITGTTRFLFKLDGDKLRAGANDIIIEVTEAGTTTRTRLTIFYFATNSPTVAMDIDQNKLKNEFPDANFKTIEPTKFQTDGRYVHLKATYGTASIVNEAYIYYNGTRVAHIDRTGKLTPSVKWEGYFANPIPANAADPNTTYSLETLYPFALEDGDNTFEIEAFSSGGLSRRDKITVTHVNPPIKVVQPDLDRDKVVNSNYIEVMIEAASADKVKIGKVDAEYMKLTARELREYIAKLPLNTQRDILTEYGMWDPNIGANGSYTPDYLDDTKVDRIDQSKVTKKRFKADVILKPGKNKITYEIEQNGKKSKYEFEIFYAASPTEGAMYKQDFKSGKVTVFDKKVNLEFPKNTWLVDKVTSKEIYDEFESDAHLKFGIVDRATGKLTKVWDNVLEQYVLENFDEPYHTLMPVWILPPDRTGYAGQIYWIESAGNLKQLDSGLVPTNRAKLSLAYDNSIRDDAQNLLAIYHFDPVKERWVNIGGVVDTKAKTVSAYIDEFGYYTVMAKRGTFHDIYNHEWAANYLTAMFSKGIMQPETLNRFGSDMLISRGEFATMLVKALEIPIDAGPYLNGDKRYPLNQTFVDVSPLLDPPNGFYSYEYIETAGRAGIIRGMGQGEFGPDALLTREQAAIMIARAANYKLTTDLAKAKSALSKNYADTNKISDYAASYVEAVLKAGVMTGSPIQGSKMMAFNPTQYLTRAETAAIAYRLMQNLKKLPK